ncbi:MAG: hypothetical protein AAF609_12590 [Cyanobacteria bacterium P01_C01_bin.120]
MSEVSEKRLIALESRLNQVEAGLKKEQQRNRELVRAYHDLVQSLQKNHRLTVRRMKMLTNDYVRVYGWIQYLNQDEKSSVDDDSDGDAD